MGFLELLPSLFAVFLLVTALVLCEVIGLAAFMAGLVYGGVALKWLMEHALEPAIDRTVSFLQIAWNRTRTPRRLIGTLWRGVVKTWRMAVAVRRAFRRAVRTVMSPVDTRLDPYPRTQWSARLIGRWSLRFALAITPVIVSVYTYVYRSRGPMPETAVIMKWQPPTIGHMRDRNGVVVMRAFYEARLQLSSAEFSDSRYDHMRNALVAAEDKWFWSHGGVNWGSTVLEGVKNVLGFSKRGASAINQQVVRNIYPEIRDIVERGKGDTLTVDNVLTRLMARAKGTAWTNKTTRKLPEIRYAVWMEEGLAQQLGSRTTAKQLILTTYANFVNLGEGVYGVEYASHRYFCKSADQLEPHEAAYIASLIPLPNVFNKVQSEEQAAAAVWRRNAILRRMNEIDVLTDEKLKVFKAKPLGLCLVPRGPKTEAPAIVEAARREMRSQGYNDEQLHRGDIEMKFTMDMAIQRIVNRAVYRNIYGDKEAKVPGFAGKYPGIKLPQAAVVILRPTGEVLALHGGFVPETLFYNYDSYNRATQARPPTGSAFKVVDMFAAVDAGIKPDDIVYDQRECIPMNLAGQMHCFDNYKDEYKGAVSFRKASAESLNGAFVSTMRHRAGGASAAIRWARELGITSPLEPYLPTVLGSNGVTPLEMAKVFARAGSGVKSEPFVVSHITARNGTVLYERRSQTKPLRLPGTDIPVSPENLNMVQQLLRGNVRLPTGTARSLVDTAKFPVEVACKTGTANDHRAAWIGCFTYGLDGIAVVAWVGYDDYTPLPAEGLPIERKASGGSLAGPIVREVFREIYGLGKPLGAPPRMPDEIELPLDEYLASANPEPDK